MGNKNDDPTRKQVDTNDAMQFGESVGVPVFETSAKENQNVEEVRRSATPDQSPASCWWLGSAARGGLGQHSQLQ